MTKKAASKSPAKSPVVKKQSHSPTLQLNLIQEVDESDDGLETDEDAGADDEMESLNSKFFPHQLEYLESKREGYRACAVNRRKEYALDAAAELLAMGGKKREKITGKKRKAAIANVKQWFRVRTKRRKKANPLEIKWTARQVFYKSNMDLVKRRQARMYAKHTGKDIDMDEVGEVDLQMVEEEEDIEDRGSDTDMDGDSDGESAGADGEPARKQVTPFHFFQRALTFEWRRLTMEERRKYQEMADEWHLKGPEIEEQRRLADAEGAATVRAFHKMVNRQMGMRMVSLMAWVDPEGDVACAFIDSGPDVGGRSFRKEFRYHLKQTRLMNVWMKFSRGELGEQEDLPAGGEVRNRGRPLLDLPRNEWNEPILHNPKKFPDGCGPKYEYLQHLVLTFVTIHLALASGREPRDTHPPWKEIRSDPRQWISAEHLPDDLVPFFRETRGLKKAESMALLSHWYGLQQRGKLPFEFHSYAGVDGMVPREPRVRIAGAPDPELQSPSNRKKSTKIAKTTKTAGKSKGATAFRVAKTEEVDELTAQISAALGIGNDSDDDLQVAPAPRKRQVNRFVVSDESDKEQGVEPSQEEDTVDHLGLFGEDEEGDGPGDDVDHGTSQQGAKVDHGRQMDIDTGKGAAGGDGGKTGQEVRGHNGPRDNGSPNPRVLNGQSPRMAVTGGESKDIHGGLEVGDIGSASTRGKPKGKSGKKKKRGSQAAKKKQEEPADEGQVDPPHDRGDGRSAVQNPAVPKPLSAKAPPVDRQATPSIDSLLDELPFKKQTPGRRPEEERNADIAGWAAPEGSRRTRRPARRALM